MDITREDAFIAKLAKTESDGKPEAWGDHGFACGAWQWHPSAFIAWHPEAHEFGARERSWNWAFEQAVRKFFRAALMACPAATDLDIAMAFHLHGYVNWTGWDHAYAARFAAA